MQPSRERIDFSVYVRAFTVYARNPTVIVLPLLVAVIGVLVSLMSDENGLVAGLTTFVLMLLQFFALGVSVIIADAGWRRGSASFDEAWQDARRKGGDILFAAMGLAIILNIAGVIPQLGIFLAAIAAYGLVYTIPAAAIGGLPGSAALNASVERVRSAPMTAAVLTVVSLVLLFIVGAYIDNLLFSLIGGSTLIIALAAAAVRAILTGYVAIVMAKVYADIAFTGSRW
jgi:hypothetical protein